MATDEERREELRTRLARGRETFLEVVSAFDEAALDRSVWAEGGTWTARELIGHVAYAESGMRPLIADGSAGNAPVPPADFDIDRYNEGKLRRARTQTIPELLARLDDSRAETLRLLAPLTGHELDLPVQHPVAGPTTVEGIFRIIAYHERLHAKDLRAALEGNEG
jgi:hypothetical protein